MSFPGRLPRPVGRPCLQDAPPIRLNLCLTRTRLYNLVRSRTKSWQNRDENRRGFGGGIGFGLGASCVTIGPAGAMGRILADAVS